MVIAIRFLYNFLYCTHDTQTPKATIPKAEFKLFAAGYLSFCLPSSKLIGSPTRWFSDSTGLASGRITWN